MPSKALPVMAGLDRKVLNSRRITKRVAPSNPVFSRSFITSFGVASHSGGRYAHNTASCPPFFHGKIGGAFGCLWEKVYICSVKPKTEKENEGIFI